MLRVAFLFGLISMVGFGFPHQTLADGSPVAMGRRQQIPVIFAVEGTPPQAAIDFYREVYRVIGRSVRWDPMPIADVRRVLDKSTDERIGGVPSIDRKEFRSKLPRRRKASKLESPASANVIPGKPVTDLQRFLDSTHVPAALVVDCARMSQNLLKACAIYYYDRQSSRVIASAVKNFVAGASDVKSWADPMLKTLENGLEAAQREKDQEVIQELVARSEQDEEHPLKGLVALYLKGDRAQLSNGFKKSINGFGIQMGFLDDTVGAVIDGGLLTWKGDGEEFKSAQRYFYGLNMIFRARALESLLWFLELGAGKEKTSYEGTTDATYFHSDGIYATLAPGVGIELSEFASLNIGVSWRWFFEGSTERNGVPSDLSQTESRIPALSLRAMILL